MAIAGIYNITIDQGAQWTLTVVYDNNNGTPFDLTGYTARMQVRPKFGSDKCCLDYFFSKFRNCDYTFDWNT